jgi:hypothetical protein
MVVGFFKILVVSNGSTDMEEELGIDNIVNGVSKGGKAVKDNNLMIFKKGASIISRDDLQDTMVNGVPFSKGYVHFGVVRMDIIVEEGGDNKIASGRVRNGKPVVRDGEWVI